MLVLKWRPRPTTPAIMSACAHEHGEAVIAFHETALASGGRDDGAPGNRQGEMTVYFGAFVRDPDGNKIEVLTIPRNEDTAAISRF